MQAGIRALWAVLLAAAAGAAGSPGGNALAVVDAYLAKAARSQPRYRTDLSLGGSNVGDRLVGWSPLLGAFAYRARSYRELTALERATLWRDPGLRRYVAGAAAAAVPLRIAPEEELRPGPLVVVLPRP